MLRENAKFLQCKCKLDDLPPGTNAERRKKPSLFARCHNATVQCDLHSSICHVLLCFLGPMYIYIYIYVKSLPLPNVCRAPHPCRKQELFLFQATSINDFGLKMTQTSCSLMLSPFGKFKSHTISPSRLKSSTMKMIPYWEQAPYFF